MVISAIWWRPAASTDHSIASPNSFARCGACAAGSRDRRHAAQDAEDRLHEQRRLHQPAIEEMREVVEMADVVALELEPRAAALAELLAGCTRCP